jgi:hypothetical protein
LTRVALTEGNVVVNSSQGGGSKDTWVLISGSNNEETISTVEDLDYSEDTLNEIFTPQMHGPDVIPVSRLHQQEEQQQQSELGGLNA